MGLDFSIVEGYITLPKEVFIKEMLSKDSIVRTILKWKNMVDFKGKHPMINENQEEGTITIKFNSSDPVSLGDDPDEILNKLKSRYKGKVKGWVALMLTYEMMGGVYYSKVDLESEE